MDRFVAKLVPSTTPPPQPKWETIPVDGAERDGFEFRICRGYLSKTQADELFAHLDTLEFDEEKIRGFVAHRKTAMFGNKGLLYNYSGRTQVLREWTEPLASLKERINDELAVTKSFEVNAALVNFYPGLHAGIGWHTDNTSKDLVPNSTIFSLSLGCQRTFQVRRNDDEERVIEFALPHGSLLAMSGTSQQFTKHHVPKSTSKKLENGKRYNITFRASIERDV